MVQTTVSVPWVAIQAVLKVRQPRSGTGIMGTREAESTAAGAEEKAGASIVVGVKVQEVRVAQEAGVPEKEKNPRLNPARPISWTYSSVAVVGGKSELASIETAELPPDTLVRIFMNEDRIVGSAGGKAERRVASAGFDVQLGSHEWEFNIDIKGVLTEQIAELSAPCISWMPGAGPEPGRINSRKRGSHFVREEAEAWRPFLDPEEEPCDGQ